MQTETHQHHYSKIIIELLIGRLELMKSHGTSINEFNEVLQMVNRLHDIQIETRTIEDDLQLPYWNGTKYVK